MSCIFLCRVLLYFDICLTAGSSINDLDQINAFKSEAITAAVDVLCSHLQKQESKFKQPPKSSALQVSKHLRNILLHNLV